MLTWATLSVRRAWQGPGIADWKGFLAGETYTYSVVWLLLGVLLLVLGSRFNAKSIRIASAVLVFAVPASPLAQPRSVLGGNIVSALVGITVALLIPQPLIAAPLAPQPLGALSLTAAVLIVAALSVFESWRVWRSDPDRQPF